MSSCGSQSNMRTREIDDVRVVGLFVGSNGGVGLAIL